LFILSTILAGQGQNPVKIGFGLRPRLLIPRRSDLIERVPPFASNPVPWGSQNSIGVSESARRRNIPKRGEAAEVIFPPPPEFRS
jgi:hypothetical protein